VGLFRLAADTMVSGDGGPGFRCSGLCRRRPLPGKSGGLEAAQEVLLLFSLYLPAVVWEMTKANIDAAGHILHPRLSLRPGIVKVKTTLKNDIALTALANSISYMPGLIVVDIDKDEGFLYVHWNDVKATDSETATKIIVERFEKILLKVFF